MVDQASPKGGKASESGGNAVEYLTKSEFLQAVAALSTRYPNFQPTVATWEAYWEDLHFIPKKYLLKGIKHCRLTLNFFPSVAQIVGASIGNHYSVVPWNGHHEPTLADIVRAYTERYERAAQLPGPQQSRQIEDRR